MRLMRVNRDVPDSTGPTRERRVQLALSQDCSPPACGHPSVKNFGLEGAAEDVGVGGYYAVLAVDVELTG